MTQPAISATVPILASLQLDESIAFYTQKLGFVQRGQWPDYAIVSQDGCEIHFFACDNVLIAQNTACYLRCGSTDALHEEFTACGLSLQAPEVRPWGMKELVVIDPHGNLLRFGEDS